MQTKVCRLVLHSTSIQLNLDDNNSFFYLLHIEWITINVERERGGVGGGGERKMKKHNKGKKGHKWLFIKKRDTHIYKEREIEMGKGQKL